MVDSSVAESLHLPEVVRNAGVRPYEVEMIILSIVYYIRAFLFRVRVQF